MNCSTIQDQQRCLRTIVEIDENDSYTTNSSSSCFTSPSLDSPPAIRRLQTLSLAPRTYDLFSPGIYSTFSPTANESISNTSLTLNRKLTSNSDSGRESVDSSFSNSENELSPPIKRFTTKSLTIYQIEKAKERQSTLPNNKRTYTASSKVYIGEDVNYGKMLEKNVNQIEPTNNILKIYIPPIVEKNVSDKFARQKEQEKKEKSAHIKPFVMDISSPRTGSDQQKIVTPKYGVDSSNYRVVAWEMKDKEPPGRIEDFKPEVDRWQNTEKSVKFTDRPSTHRQSTKNDSSSSTSSSIVELSAVRPESLTSQHSKTHIEYYTLNCNPPSNLQVTKEEIEDEPGNTLSDVSSYSSGISECQLPISQSNSVKSFSTNKSEPSTDNKSDLESYLSYSSFNTIEKKHPNSVNSVNSIKSNNSSQVRIRETTDSMLQDRIVEVGVQPWRSHSLEKFTKSNKFVPQAPRLLEERTKKRVIFPQHPTLAEQHLYENIDDCRERGVEHPDKVMPIPNQRLPFRQPARVPLLSIPKVDREADDEVSLHEVGPEISYVSYRFYDKNMQEQNSLSQRCSAQLLRKSAMRLSLPRSQPKTNSNQIFRRRNILHVMPPAQIKYQSSHPMNQSNSTEPLRYQLTAYKKNSTKNEDDSIVTVNGKQSCANCHLQLGRGQAMTIDSLGLFYHLHCFRCAKCGILLNSGESKGMDVRVSGTQIQCNQCYNLSEEDFHYSHI